LLLAYDGTELAAQALNIAAYLARRWNIKLAVLTAHESHSQGIKIQQCARQMLASHNVGAVFVINTSQNVVDAILQTAVEQGSNLILMGAHGLNAPWYYKVGGAVAKVLQKSNQPVLICR
jgi:nucleotide-binding universal stress UspA family protein